MTNDLCKVMIEACGVSTNPLKGIVGMYYTDNREQDLKDLIHFILRERQ